jgi:hypothetical protein
MVCTVLQHPPRQHVLAESQIASHLRLLAALLDHHLHRPLLEFLVKLRGFFLFSSDIERSLLFITLLSVRFSEEDQATPVSQASSSKE